MLAPRKQASFEANPAAIGAARHFVRSLLGDDERAEDAELITSELATNALRHAGSPFTVTVTRNPRLRIEVHDASDRLPARRADTPDAVDGHGLRIVEAVACTWGSQLVPKGGKVVWAELEAR